MDWKPDRRFTLKGPKLGCIARFARCEAAHGRHTDTAKFFILSLRDKI
jgi:hypothetical protein